MENQEKQHKRRVRYSGTHPRRFEEKYKELQPEKYEDTIEKVIQKEARRLGCTFLSGKGDIGISSDSSQVRRDWMLHWDMEVIPGRC